MHLRNLLRENHHQVMGPGWHADWCFPLLIKWLDCSRRLSLQVHPPLETAQKLNEEPKTENWYVVKNSKNAGLFLGLKRGCTKKSFLTALKSNRLENECHWVNSEAGMSVFVPSGRLHAIDRGNLILEIQQNSDSTFRVYDWNRKDLNGKCRPLHINESIESINFNDFEPKPLVPSSKRDQTLATCPFFRIRKFVRKKNETLIIKKVNEQCMVINPINCEVMCENEYIECGNLGLSPYSEKCSITFKDSGDVLITDHFFIPA